MSIDQDYQFDFEGFTFGLRTELPTTDGGFDPGEAPWRTQDSDNETGDGRSFGTDYLGAPTWTWSLFTDREDAAEALDTIRRFAKVWRNGAHRRVPGDVRALTYSIGDRTRRVYGRPRRLSYPPDNKILSGFVPVAASFDCVDALHYDDAETSVVLNGSPSSLGRFPVPIPSLPWTPVATGAAQSTQAVVDGDADTYPVVVFRASATSPMGNPRVLIGADEYGLTGYTIPAGASVTIDTRAWAMKAVRENGVSVAGFLTAGTRLDIPTLSPGTYPVSFTATDTSGTGTCTVSWRPAYYSL